MMLRNCLLKRIIHSGSTIPKNSHIFNRFFSVGDTVISFKDVSFEYRPLHPLLLETSFSIKEGSKVTIMGQNGSGKSTLLKLMNGLLKPTHGAVHIKNNLALSRALQVVPPEDRNKTVKEFFEARLHGNTSGMDARIVKALQQVEFEGIDLTRTMKSFSGGQQARLLLASTLILEPDVLLLDEPTNNLDTQGIDMLSGIIVGTEKTCVVISHDEDFLNIFTDSVIYIDSYQKKVEYYDGNYNDVKKEIAQRIERENLLNVRLQKDIQQKKNQASAFANKGGAIRKVAKKLREAAEELESEKVDVRREDRTLPTFTIPDQPKDNASISIGRKALKISSIIIPRSGIHLDYSIAPIILDKGAHVRIKGPNGVGKTTLLESIVKNRAEGIELNPNLRIGYYRQDFHNLNHTATVHECLQEAAAERRHSEGHIRKTASLFMIGRDVKQIVGTLSEGQKGLLSLCCLVLQEPGFLIMDEPTNHINFRHLPVIAQALNDYKGALLVVSHDEDFVRKLKIDQVIDLSNAKKKK